MSGKLNFLSAKVAKALSQGVASALQKKEKKRKRTQPDTRVVDDHPAVKSSSTDPLVFLVVTLTGHLQLVLLLIRPRPSP